MFLRRQSRRNRRQGMSASFVTESLEGRQLLTTFGNAWDDARGLTVSFPADGTPLGATGNQLRSLLDASADRAAWQTAILRAFQTWSEVADINFGLVADRGDAFGAVGLSSSDPRFGDFRIGALPLPGVLANAVPGQAVAGTWSGDIFFSTETNWYLANVGSGHSAAAADGAYDLYSVALHEVGNALGLADQTAAGSVMSAQYSTAVSGLTASDVAAIQAIYGERTDPFESQSNNSRGTATVIQLDAAEAAAGVAIRSGSLLNAADSDVYSFVVPEGVTAAAVTLRAQGISLLESELDLRSAAGGRVAVGYSKSIFANDVRVVSASLQSGATYYVHIDSQKNSDFTSGDYQLELNFHPESDWLPVNGRQHDAGRYNGRARLDDADRVDLPGLFAGAILDGETAGNNTFVTATQLETTIGFRDGIHYEAVGTVLGSGDRDFLSFQAPQQAADVLVVRFTPLDGAEVNVQLAVMNANGDRVEALVNRSANGQYEVQIREPEAGATYVVGMKLEADAADAPVNYALTADFAVAAAHDQQSSQAQIVAGEIQLGRISSLKSQLFRLDLSNLSEVSGDKVAINVIDLRNQQTVQTVMATAGATESIFIWLPEGEYGIAVRGKAADGGSTAIGYRIDVSVVSDDEGPGYVDPLDPDGSTGDQDPYIYEDPYAGTEDPYEDPWLDPYFLGGDPWENDPFALFVKEIYYLEIE